MKACKLNPDRCHSIITRSLYGGSPLHDHHSLEDMTARPSKTIKKKSNDKKCILPIQKLTGDTKFFRKWEMNFCSIAFFTVTNAEPYFSHVLLASPPSMGCFSIL
jgi:hypothetical protein